MVRGSWFAVRGSWFVVRGSWFAIEQGLKDTNHGQTYFSIFVDLVNLRL